MQKWKEDLTSWRWTAYNDLREYSNEIKLEMMWLRREPVHNKLELEQYWNWNKRIEIFWPPNENGVEEAPL